MRRNQATLRFNVQFRLAHKFQYHMFSCIGTYKWHWTPPNTLNHACKSCGSIEKSCTEYSSYYHHKPAVWKLHVRKWWVSHRPSNQTEQTIKDKKCTMIF
eukprot:504085_1